MNASLAKKQADNAPGVDSKILKYIDVASQQGKYSLTFLPDELSPRDIEGLSRLGYELVSSDKSIVISWGNA